MKVMHDYVESFSPEMAGEVYIEHLHRYVAAAELCRDKSVLDVSCGEGYGSYILAQQAHSVFGLDIRQEKLKQARIKYEEQKNLHFITSRCDQLPVAASTFDVAVSFETIEHILEQEDYLSELKRLLRPNGQLIISTPNKKVYRQFTGGANPFHPAELDEYEFVSMVKRHFSKVLILNQQVVTVSLVAPAEILAGAAVTPFQVYEENSLNEVSSKRALKDLMYTLIVASNGEKPCLDGSLYLGTTEETSGIHVPMHPEWPQKYIGLIPVELFFDTGKGFNAYESICRYLRPGERKVTFQFNNPLPLSALRFDPGNMQCIVKLISGLAADLDGKQVELDMYYNNGASLSENTYFFDTRDPQFFFKPAILDLPLTAVSFELEYLMAGEPVLSGLFRSSHQVGIDLKAQGEQTEKKIIKLKEKNTRQNEKIKTLQHELHRHGIYHQTLLKQNQQYREEFIRLSRTYEAIVKQVEVLRERLYTHTHGINSEMYRSAVAETGPLNTRFALNEIAYQIERFAQRFANVTQQCDELKTMLGQLEGNLLETRREKAHLQAELESIKALQDENRQIIEHFNNSLSQISENNDELRKLLDEAHQSSVRFESEREKWLKDRNEEISRLTDAANQRSQEEKSRLTLQVMNLASDKFNRFAYLGWHFVMRLRPLYKAAGWIVSSAERINRHREIKLIRQSGLFDPEYYLEQYPDVAASGTDPLIHFACNGWREGRQPNPGFNLVEYILSRPDVAQAGINPLIHFIRYGRAELKRGQGKASPIDRPDATVQATPEAAVPIGIRETAIKAVAFYLPQYHPIPENDRWWGKGFTEWTKVSQARPLFPGHDQPKIPGDLGFYDLRLLDIQRQQAEMARQYGLFGFCYYYYWFNGKRLLDIPLLQMLAHPEIDFPFCICWANENWTRRWDGLDQEILIRQEYSPDADVEFIRDLEPFLRDPRYIKVHGRPLLAVYRPDLLPDSSGTAARWRQHCRECGIGEIFLVMVQTNFGESDPRPLGFDAAIHFPPHCSSIRNITGSVPGLADDFRGLIYSYEHLAESEVHRQPPPYTWFRGIMPGWDNTPRRGMQSHLAYGSTPARYEKWLDHICDYTIRQNPEGERFVFFNAWNEWAEGAYLEPDARYGYAFLNRTAKVLAKYPEQKKKPGSWKILFVSHDACMGGAQLVLLNLLKWLKEHTHIEIKILLLGEGSWTGRFHELGDTLLLPELMTSGVDPAHLPERVAAFCGGLPDLIYGNSVASGGAYPWLARLNRPIVTHFHELEISIRRYASGVIGDVIRHSTHFIACSEAVRRNLEERYAVPPDRISTVYSSIDRPDAERAKTAPGLSGGGRATIRKSPAQKIVLGCGIGMPFRKGADLFIEVARQLAGKGANDFHFYWIGGFDRNEPDDHGGTWADYLERMRRDGLNRHVTFLGQVDNPREYLAEGDLFLLPSREDPFPLVALEAASCGLPVVCFEGAGGMPEFVKGDCGVVIPFLDTAAMADEVLHLFRESGRARQLGDNACRTMQERYCTDATAPGILAVCTETAGRKPAVSVIVPSYNHAPYLTARLDSIYGQNFRDFEVIVLDDASTDASREVLRSYESRPRTRVFYNPENSGSPFRQWLMGLAETRGELVWIAESDDVADPAFLEEVLPQFADPRVRVAYADSVVIDETGRMTGDYQQCDYLLDLSPTKWRKSYQVEADQELREALAIKNTVLNASAVVFRRFTLSSEARETLRSLRMAGDWFFLLQALEGGRIHFLARQLNQHRRHAASVIGGVNSDVRKQDLLREIARVHRYLFGRYRFDRVFRQKWESYLRKQWADFFPGRNFQELEEVYPFAELKRLLQEQSVGD